MLLRLSSQEKQFCERGKKKHQQLEIDHTLVVKRLISFKNNSCQSLRTEEYTKRK